MEIKKAKYLISSVNVEGCPKPDRPEFAFIGRSNVGKSSLINMLCKLPKLAKTSGTPGKTQHINHFLINEHIDSEPNWFLVDLPGYGYAKVSKKSRKAWWEMIENYLLKRENLTCLMILIDSRHEPQTIDLEFIKKVGGWRVPFAILFTKADKSKQTIVSKNMNDFSMALLKNWEELPPMFLTSAEKGQGRVNVLNFMEKSMLNDEV